MALGKLGRAGFDGCILLLFEIIRDASFSVLFTSCLVFCSLSVCIFLLYFILLLLLARSLLSIGYLKPGICGGGGSEGTGGNFSKPI